MWVTILNYIELVTRSTNETNILGGERTRLR